jgi:hypothetical protein
MEPTAIYATRQGNLAGEKIEMSVDAASMAHVMSILTDLYSDPTLAVIREYSTNARDAMIEAGNGDMPIEVSLPNAMSPFFKVRDYGVGLSVEDIRDIYSKYGASTKRSTNEQVGMLGLGCKSALTYTQQFTVRSVKDGQLVLVAISRTESGSGVMEVVHTSEIDESNGVEISVPVTRNNDFESKARNFFRFWEPGTVLVNGKAPAYIAEEATKIADNLYIIQGIQNDFVVMGNVGYRTDSDHPLYQPKNSYRYYGRNFGVVAIVPIGSVNFTPSREDLHYTTKTNDTVREIQQNVEKNLRISIQKEIDEQESPIEGRKIAEKWASIAQMHHTSFTYKGASIPASVRADHFRYHVNYGRGSVDSYIDLPFNQAERFVFISGYENEKVSTAHRAKVRLWASQNGYSNSTYILSAKPIDFTWFTPVASTTWEEVFKTRVPRDKAVVEKPTYRVRVKDVRYDQNLDELPAHKRIVLWTSGDKDVAEYVTKAISLTDDTIAVNLPKNRWAKFIRENKNVIEFSDFVKQMMNETLDNLTEEDVLFITLNYDERRTLPLLDETKIDDPVLSKKIAASKVAKSDTVVAYWEVYNMCNRMHFEVKTPDKQPSAFETYPLIHAVNGLALSIEHCYTYVNTIYNSNS